MAAAQLPSLRWQGVEATLGDRRKGPAEFKPTAESLSFTAPARGEGRQPGDGKGGLPSVKMQDWQAQAASSVKEVTMEKFRSVALYAEVKLAEALNRVRAAKIKASGGEMPDEEGPDRLRTAVCVQILCELCEMTGPLAPVLAKIRDELVQSIYSDYYLPQSGDSIFEQQPFFCAIRRIEKEKGQLAREQERFRDILMDRDEDMTQIQEQAEGMNEMLQKATAHAETLQHLLDTANTKITTLKAEAEGKGSENQKLKAEVALLRSELDQSLQREQEAESSLSQVSALQNVQTEMEEEIEGLKRRLAAADARLADSVPSAVHQKVKGELDSLNEQIARAKAAGGEGGEEGGLERMLTPRPDWEQLREAHPLGELAPGPQTNTRQAVADLFAGGARLLGEAAVAKEENARFVSQAEVFHALLEPEPEARVLSPNFASSSVLNAETGEKEETLCIQAFGLGKDIPRFLRYAGTVAFAELEVSALRRLIQDVWTEKGKFDAARAKVVPLQNFMYYYLNEQCESQYEVAEMGYNILAACEKYFEGDSEAELFISVLQGQLSEEVWEDREHMLRSLAAMLRAADLEGTGEVTVHELTDVLERLFPNKPEGKRSAILRTVDAKAAVEDLLARDGDFHPFLETVIYQHLEEIKDYQQGLRKEILGLAAEGSTSVDLAELRAAIAAYDPAKAEADVELLMARGSRLRTLADVPGFIAREQVADLPLFLQRLGGGLVKRSNNFAPSAKVRPAAGQDSTALPEQA